MSWMEIDARTGGTKVYGIRVSRITRGVVVVFGEDVLQALGLGSSQKFKVLVGSGTDTGKLRLVRSNTGYTLTTHNRNSPCRILRIRAWPGLKPGRCQSRPVEYRVLGDTIEIDLPEWGREIDEVAAHIATKGVTKCPTKYAAPTQAAADAATAARRLASMAAVDHQADSWKGRKSA